MKVSRHNLNFLNVHLILKLIFVLWGEVASLYENDINTNFFIILLYFLYL